VGGQTNVKRKKTKNRKQRTRITLEAKKKWVAVFNNSANHLVLPMTFRLFTLPFSKKRQSEGEDCVCKGGEKVLGTGGEFSESMRKKTLGEIYWKTRDKIGGRRGNRPIKFWEMIKMRWGT